MALLLLLCLPGLALAQSSGGYDLTRSKVAGGGGTTTGGGYKVLGTVGEHDAGRMSGGGYTLIGGFFPQPPAGVRRPNPDPEIGLGNVAGSTVQACNSEADCSDFGVGPNVDCIPAADGSFPGTCYVSASRYLSISPNDENTGPTARRITLDINGNDTFDPGVDHVLGWVDEPFATNVVGPEPSPQAQARVSATSVYRNWSDLTDIDPVLTGARPVHLGDCEIAPKGSAGQGAVIGNVYFIQAIGLGSDESDEGLYSAPLRLRTTARYGDPVGTGLGSNYPNNSVSLLDAFAGVLGFQGAQQAPMWRLEMTGGQLSDNVPNFANVTLLDVFDIVGAFQSGGVYPYDQPCDCDGQNCP